MFDSDLLDRLSRVHPVVPPLIFLPAVGVLFAVLRLRARHLAAPVLTHTATNSFAYVAALLVS